MSRPGSDNAPQIDTRPYQDGDWDGVCRVHDLARPDELRGSCDPRAFIPIAQDPEAEDLKRCAKHVACDGVRIVGFVGVSGDYLGWLYVDPEYYGRGIGRRLLRLVLPLLGPTAWTIVLDGNLGAIRLYESEGFAVARTYMGDNAGYPCRCHRLTLGGTMRAPGDP